MVGQKNFVEDGLLGDSESWLAIPAICGAQNIFEMATSTKQYLQQSCLNFVPAASLRFRVNKAGGSQN